MSTGKSTENVGDGERCLLPMPTSNLSFWRLAKYFFWIGLTTVQGATGHVRRKVVDRWKLVSERDFFESFGLSEFIPQPDSTFGLAVHLGQRIRGPWGGVVVAFSMMLPSFILASILGFVYLHYSSNPKVAAAIAGTAAGCCAVIMATVLEIGKKAVTRVSDFLLVAAVFLLLQVFHVHIGGVFLWVTPVGLWLNRPGRRSGLPRLAFEPPGLVPTRGFRHHVRHALGRVIRPGRRWIIGGVALAVGGAVWVMWGNPIGLVSLLEQRIDGPPPQENADAVVCRPSPLEQLTDGIIPSNTLDGRSLTRVCLDVATTFSTLSVCAFGGEETILPCMEHTSVDHHGWMRADEFVDLFALSFVVPGPSMLASMVGMRACAPYGNAAALTGGVVGALAIFLPSIAIVLLAGKFWERLRHWAWRPAIGHVLLIVATGALSAAVAFVARSSLDSPSAVAIALGAVGLLVFTELNPVLIIALTAAGGFFFLG